MRKYLLSTISSYKKGFTLIELLVVLAILGILAAALLAAINPVEQINKGQDASMEEEASEFVTAANSYYTAYNQPIWGQGSCPASPTAGSAMNGATIQSCISLLTTSGDLKASFATSSNLSNL